MPLMSVVSRLVQIYECFCEPTRLRILNLLSQGPLCVCHFQGILGETQVKVSKHLGYLRERGLVRAVRHQNWMVYALPQNQTEELARNLACLRECAASDPAFERDLKQLRAMGPREDWEAYGALCAGEVSVAGGAAQGSGSGGVRCGLQR